LGQQQEYGEKQIDLRDIISEYARPVDRLDMRDKGEEHVRNDS